MSYENLPGSSTSHFSAERTDPVDYVEMGKRRSVQLADSRGQPGFHCSPGLTLKRVLSNLSPCNEKNDEKMDEKDDDDEEEGREYLTLIGSGN